MLKSLVVTFEYREIHVHTWEPSVVDSLIDTGCNYGRFGVVEETGAQTHKSLPVDTSMASISFFLLFVEAFMNFSCKVLHWGRSWGHIFSIGAVKPAFCAISMKSNEVFGRTCKQPEILSPKCSMQIDFGRTCEHWCRGGWLFSLWQFYQHFVPKNVLVFLF